MALVYCIASDCVFHDGACDCQLLQVDIDWEGNCSHYKILEDFIEGFTSEEAEAFVRIVDEEQNGRRNNKREISECTARSGD